MGSGTPITLRALAGTLASPALAVILALPIASWTYLKTYQGGGDLGLVLGLRVRTVAEILTFYVWFNMIMFWIRWGRMHDVLKQGIKAVASHAKETDAQLEEHVYQCSTRITAMVHNVVCLSFIAVAFSDPELTSDKGEAASLTNVTPWSVLITAISAGHFVWDLQICAGGHEGLAYFFHAITGCIAMVLSCYNQVVQFYACWFLSWEMSTFFVHGRWFMHLFGMKDTKAYLYNGYCMLATFLVFRVISGPICMYFFLSKAWGLHAAGKPPWRIEFTVFSTVGQIIMNGLNYYWFYKMVSGAVKHIYGSKKKN